MTSETPYKNSIDSILICLTNRCLELIIPPIYFIPHYNIARNMFYLFSSIEPTGSIR